MTIERAITASESASLIERGKLLSRATLAYNSAEGVAAIVTGALAGSVALMGFGVDSIIEVVSSAAALRRLGADADAEQRERAERFSLRIIGACFLALSLYIVVDGGHALLTHEVPGRTIPGIIVATLSVVIMPLLARGKRRVAVGLGSRALAADATQTDLCMYLSAIVLGGLLLNALVGWWWADPVAALIMVPIIAREGLEGWRGEEGCDDG
jgi:divalent metal cation (Fe/Co/Zn/Cd) transporter